MPKKKRENILKLEKQMQKKPTAEIVISLAEKYLEADEAHQAVAVLLEGIEKFPEDIRLQIRCARLMIHHQTDETSRAELMIKHVLAMSPENTEAQELLEEIHAQVDTMFEVAKETDTKEMQAQRTIRMPIDEKSDDLPAYHKLLTEGYRCYHSGNIEKALEVFQSILEEDPSNSDAQEGFRLAYTDKLTTQETDVRRQRLERKLDVIKRSVHYLEAMKKAVSKGRGNE